MTENGDPVAWLDLPDHCKVDRRVFKKLFREKPRLGATDKKALSEDVESVTWRYALKPDRLPIAPVRADDLDYLEIDVIQVDLRRRTRVTRVCELIHRAIPYPVLVVATTEDAFAFSAGQKRKSELDADSTVLERTFFTGWIARSERLEAEEDFLESLRFDQMRSADFRDLYNEYVDRIVGMCSARQAGPFEVGGPGSTDRRTRLLDDLERLNAALTAERRKLEAETHFNRKVEMNSRIKAMDAERKATLEALQSER